MLEYEILFFNIFINKIKNPLVDLFFSKLSIITLNFGLSSLFFSISFNTNNILLSHYLSIVEKLNELISPKLKRIFLLFVLLIFQLYFFYLKLIQY